MKKILYISALAIVSSMSLTSCEDFLEAENKSAGGATSDKYFPTAEGLKGYRNYAYSCLNSLVGGYLDMQDGASDIYWQSRGRISNYDVFQVTAETGDFSSFYTNAYKLINAANGVMYYGSEYNSDAKFLRAYGYYLLTQQFGSVPYITKYINDATKNYPRADLKTIYDGILADLDDVIADEKVADVSHDGLVNKKSACALAAKIALAAGWDLQTKVTDASAGTYTVEGTDYFQKSAAYAEKALAGVTLIDNFADKWSPYNENNSEVFYAVQYDRAVYATIGDDAEGGHSLQNHYGGYYGAQTTTGQKYCNSDAGKSLKALYLWDAGDERYDATFQNTFYNYDGSWGTSGYYAYLNLAPEKLAKTNIAYYYASPATSRASFDAFVNDGVANGIWAYDSKGVTSPYRNSSFAYLLGATCVKVTFSSDGKVSATATLSFEDLQQEVNSIDCVKKWDDPNTYESTSSKNSYRDIVTLHASETMLTAAEAYLMSKNEAKALEFVNKVRARAKASVLTSFAAYDPAYNYEGGYNVKLTAVDVILDERGRELFGEPGRWVDLRRTKQLVRYNLLFRPKNLGVTLASMSNAKGEIKWLRAIPAAEISSNNGISDADQNPGY